jgi:hypothetical protein
LESDSFSIFFKYIGLISGPIGWISPKIFIINLTPDFSRALALAKREKHRQSCDA